MSKAKKGNKMSAILLIFAVICFITSLILTAICDELEETKLDNK